MMRVAADCGDASISELLLMLAIQGLSSSVRDTLDGQHC